MVGEVDLVRGGGAGLHRLSGLEEILVFHSVSVVLEVFDFTTVRVSPTRS